MKNIRVKIKQWLEAHKIVCPVVIPIKKIEFQMPLRSPVQKRQIDRRESARHIRRFIIEKICRPQMISATSLCLSLILGFLTFKTYQDSQKQRYDAAAIESKYEEEIKEAGKLLYIEKVENVSEKNILNERGFVMISKRLFQSCSLEDEWDGLNFGKDNIGEQSQILLDNDLKFDSKSDDYLQEIALKLGVADPVAQMDIYGSDYVGTGPYYPYRGRWKGEIVDIDAIVASFKSDQCFHIYYKLGVRGDRQSVDGNSFLMERLAIQIGKPRDLIAYWNLIKKTNPTVDDEEGRLLLRKIFERCAVVVYPFRWGWKWSTLDFDGHRIELPKDGSSPRSIRPLTVMSGLDKRSYSIANKINKLISGPGVIPELKEATKQ